MNDPRLAIGLIDLAVARTVATLRPCFTLQLPQDGRPQSYKLATGKWHDLPKIRWGNQDVEDFSIAPKFPVKMGMINLGVLLILAQH